jgi:hypothetical protein
MYCSETARWIPIQLTWIQGLSENYYRVHFAALFRQFKIPSFTRAERKTLERQVVDFLLAQRGVCYGVYGSFWQVQSSSSLEAIEGMPRALQSSSYKNQKKQVGDTGS